VRRWIFALLACVAFLVAAGVAHAETCTSSGNFEWPSIAEGTWTGCTASADDVFQIASSVRATGNLVQDTTAGAKIVVQSGGHLLVRSADKGGEATCTSGDCFLDVALGTDGLECQAGGQLTIEGLFRNFGPTAAGEASADTTLQSIPVEWIAGDLVPCPGGDCNLLRIDYSDGAYDPQNVDGNASDPRIDEYLGALTTNDLLCFWDFDQSDAWQPAQNRSCYEIAAVDNSGTCSGTCAIDIDLRQGAQGGGYPQPLRQILQEPLQARVNAGGDRIELPTTVLQQVASPSGQDGQCDTGAGERCDQLYRSLVGRFLQFTDASGRLGDARYPVVEHRNDVVCGVASTGTLTLTANAADGEAVTIDAKTYTFQATLTDVDGNVLIGASASATLDNLIAAIDLGPGAGTVYAASTTAHPTVDAVAGAGDAMDATAEDGGVAGNEIATTETVANGAWGGATLSGGDEDPECSRDSIQAARSVDLFETVPAVYGGGFARPHEAGESVQITYGIRRGDPFFVGVWPRIGSATAATVEDDDSPVGLDCLIDVVGAWWQEIGVGPINNPVNSNTALAIGPSATGSWKHNFVQSLSARASNNIGMSLAASMTLGHTSFAGGDPNTDAGFISGEGVHALFMVADAAEPISPIIEDWSVRHANEMFAVTGGTGVTAGLARRIQWAWPEQDGTTVNGYAAQTSPSEIRFEDVTCVACTSFHVDNAAVFEGTAFDLTAQSVLALGVSEIFSSNLTSCLSTDVLGFGHATVRNCIASRVALVRSTASGFLVGGRYTDVLLDTPRTASSRLINARDGDVLANVMILDPSTSSGTPLDLLRPVQNDLDVRLQDVTIAWRLGFDEKIGIGNIGEFVDIIDYRSPSLSNIQEGDGVLVWGYDRDGSTGGNAVSVNTINQSVLQQINSNISDPYCLFDNGANGAGDLFNFSTVAAELTRVVRGQAFAFEDPERGDFTPLPGSIPMQQQCGAGRDRPPGVTRQLRPASAFGIGPVFMGITAPEPVGLPSSFPGGGRGYPRD